MNATPADERASSARPERRRRRPWLAAARIAPLALAGTLLLAGCTATAAAVDGASDAGTDATVQLSGSGAVDPGATAAEIMAANEAPPGEESDSAWDEASVVDIALDGDTVTVADDAEGVTVDGATVTITAAGTYRMSGELAGQVVVDTGDEELVRLILDGAGISSDSTAAIAVTSAERVQLLLADSSANTLADASSYATDADVNAALFSSADLEITGDGALTVHGNGNDGIASKDGLLISGGDIMVEAVDDGIRGKDQVVIEGGTIEVTAGGDGLKADNAEEADRGYLAIAGGTVTVAAGGDGLDAATDVVIWGGTLDVTESYEGLEAAAITIGGGINTVVASDDGVNAGGTLAISGGETTIEAEGDGLDSNGTIVMSGGTVVVNGPTGQGNGALDVDGTFDITGGVLLAAGSSGMAVAPSADAAQASVLVTFSRSVAAGTVLEVTGDDGTAVATVTTTKAAQSLVVSTSDLVNGQTYTVSAGGTEVGSAVAGEQVSGMGGMGAQGGQPPRG